MSATITTFISALTLPANHFRTLYDATVEERVEVSRTTHFADVQIEWHGKSYLLSLPLTQAALRMAQVAAVRLKTVRSKIILDYRILPSELSYVDKQGNLRSEDLLLQELPQGAPLVESVNSLGEASLMAAIEELRSEFKRLKLLHNNIKPENIMVGEDNRLYPLRFHYMEFSDCSSDDFDSLSAYVSENSTRKVLPEEGCWSVKESPLLSKEHLSFLYGYTFVGNPFEGLCVVQNRDGLYGYISTDGKEIITPQYIWAGDIREGRAEVETADGMGVIDATGRYILEPKYQIVDFDPDTCVIRVKESEKWSRYSYDGHLIVEREELKVVG